MRVRLALLGASLVLAGCAPAPTALLVSGTVVDDPVIVAVPVLRAPALAGGAGATYGLGSVVEISEVMVSEGQSVRVGQALARMDDRVLSAQVSAAKADAEVAATGVDQLASAIDKTYDKAAEVKDKKEQVKDAISQLTKAKQKLIKARAQLKAQRPAVAEQLRQAQQLLDNYPPVPVPGVPSREQLTAAIAKLKAALTQMDAGLKQINTNLPKIEKGLAKANDGLKKLDDAAATITDARAQLVDLKELATIAEATMQIPIQAATLQLSLATITAPVDGVVLSAASVGDRLAPGATAVSLRETAPSRVTAWLAPSQLARVCLDDSAEITGDWSTAATPARITRISPTAEYPPSSVATDEVHLTRAVEITLTATDQLPAGVPVQISIQGCRLATEPTSADR